MRIVNYTQNAKGDTLVTSTNHSGASTSNSSSVGTKSAANSLPHNVATSSPLHKAVLTPKPLSSSTSLSKLPPATNSVNAPTISSVAPPINLSKVNDESAVKISANKIVPIDGIKGRTSTIETSSIRSKEEPSAKVPPTAKATEPLSTKKPRVKLARKRAPAGTTSIFSCLFVLGFRPKTRLRLSLQRKLYMYRLTHGKPAPATATAPERVWYEVSGVAQSNTGTLRSRRRNSWLSSMTKAEYQKQAASFELLMTEEDYVRDMTFVVKMFIEPWREEKVLSAKALDTIFGNFEHILPIHQTLLKELRALRGKERPFGIGHPNLMMNGIGAILLPLIDFLKMYTAYCERQSKGIAFLREQGELIEYYCKKVSKLPECRGMPLDSYLLKPVQRIMRYPMLIKEILKHTPKLHPDYEDLSKALSKLEEIVSGVNEFARKAERIHETLQTCVNIVFPLKINLVTPTRMIIKQGVFKSSIAIVRGDNSKIGLSNETPILRHFLLFTDLIVIALPSATSSGIFDGQLIWMLNKIQFNVDGTLSSDQKLGQFWHVSEKGTQRCAIWCKNESECSDWIAMIKEAQVAEVQSRNEAKARGLDLVDNADQDFGKYEFL